MELGPPACDRKQNSRMMDSNETASFMTDKQLISPKEVRKLQGDTG